MSKIIDITNKLNFEEKPIIKVKNIEIEANNDATTILKVVALFGENGKSMTTEGILTAFNLLFDKENRKKIENLKMPMKTFSEFIMITVEQMINNGEEPDEGETATPATT